MSNKPFDFIVNLGDFIEAGQSVGRALGNKVGVINYVYVSVGEDKVTLRGMDGQKIISHSVTAEVTTPGTFCVDRFLFGVIGRYSDKNAPIRFLQSEKEGEVQNEFSVSQGRKSNKFNLVHCVDYPEKPDFDNEYIDIELGDLFHVLNLAKVAFNTDNKQAKEVLTCYHLDLENRVLHTGSGSQFVQYKDINVKGNMTILPRIKQIADDMSLLQKLETAEDGKAFLSQDYVGFKSDILGLEVLYQTFNGDPLDLGKIFSTIEANQPKASITLPTAQLVEALRVCVMYEAKAMSSGEPSYTAVKVSDDVINLSIEIKQLSSNNEELEGEGEGTFNGRVEASKLLNALTGGLKSEYVTLSFRGAKAPVHLTTAEEPNFCYLQT